MTFIGGETGGECESLDAASFQDFDELALRERRVANDVLAKDQIVADDEHRDRVALRIFHGIRERRQNCFHCLNDARMSRRIERARVDGGDDGGHQLLHLHLHQSTADLAHERIARRQPALDELLARVGRIRRQRLIRGASFR